jgi:2-polyprenyl-3-methyl-5-hydroxy-6-metoxy-1,4-benzoquinol methylase
MEEALFDAIHEHAERHWWFRARQRIVTHLLDRYHGPRSASESRVLDLGCGVGNELAALARYGEVYGADASDKALALCRQRFQGPLDRVRLPDEVPYADEMFNLVVMLDVLEHVHDDAATLVRVRHLLEPGGMLCLTVPALRWLWSYHDVEHHHFRRYHRNELARLLLRQGYEIVLISYMNTVLLPFMGVARLMLQPETWTSSHLHAGTGPLSEVFYRAFALERHVIPHARLPLGGSLVALARRPAGALS